jgi:hypothetical protein
MLPLFGSDTVADKIPIEIGAIAEPVMASMPEE